jgi:hypothetical protein
MARRRRYIIASRAEHIDPADCGSIVSYRIRRGYHGLQADIDLTDCDRKISWYFNNDVESVKKIDKAIEILSRFRAEFVTARAKLRKKK